MRIFWLCFFIFLSQEVCAQKDSVAIYATDTVRLKDIALDAKSKSRKLREQAMPVAIISMDELGGKVTNVSDIIMKTVGVTIRSSGGVGSSSRLSVRGLEGKRIGFFIDETPLSDQSDFIDLNDIPVDMIERIEIYKGIVPAKFGGSSMGGAVNLVIKEYPDKYADISYLIESFNTHKVQSVLKRNLKEKGLIFGLGGGYTYSDNDYTMNSPYVEGLKIKRNHDTFKKIMIGGVFTAKKWWFDEVNFEPVFIDTYREIQGIKTDIREALIKSRAYVLSNNLEKNNFLLPGLDFDASTSIAYTQYNLIDKATMWYDWDGNAYPTASIYGGELDSRIASDSDDKKFTLLNKVNVEYLINKQHTLNFNSFFTLANAHPKDKLRELSLGKKTNFDSKMRSWVGGVTYDFRTKNDVFLNSITARFYHYSMDTKKTLLYGFTTPEKVNINKSDFGISNATRYKFTSSTMAKIAVGKDVRIPSETELLGDGYFVSASENLKPEQNTSVNAGILYFENGGHNLQIELNGFYMHLKDMIRFTKGILGAQYQNFGEMQTIGTELEVKADIFPFLYGYANATYQDLRDVRDYEENSQIPNPTKNKRMPNIPYLLANAGLEFHKENLFGGTGQNTRVFSDVSFVEEYYYDFELTQNEKRRIPTSVSIDIGAEHSFYENRLFLSAKIKNLTDAEILSEFNRPLPGRSFGIKIRYILK